MPHVLHRPNTRSSVKKSPFLGWGEGGGAAHTVLFTDVSRLGSGFGVGDGKGEGVGWGWRWERGRSGVINTSDILTLRKLGQQYVHLRLVGHHYFKWLSLWVHLHVVGILLFMSLT